MQKASTEKITLSFPKDLITKINKRVRKGQVSPFVAEAVREKIEEEERAALRKELIEGYRVRASLHRRLAAEFFEAEEEAYEASLSHGEDQRKAESREG